jgi:hypothetical protein
MGEVGMSLSANSLALGCDCRGEIFYFDGTLNDLVGRAVTILSAVRMHEGDYGIAWKHTDCRIQEVEARSRRLVISMIKPPALEAGVGGAVASLLPGNAKAAQSGCRRRSAPQSGRRR